MNVIWILERRSEEISSGSYRDRARGRSGMYVIWILERGGDDCLLEPTEKERGDEYHLDPKESG